MVTCSAESVEIALAAWRARNVGSVTDATAKCSAATMIISEPIHVVP